MDRETEGGSYCHVKNGLSLCARTQENGWTHFSEPHLTVRSMLELVDDLAYASPDKSNRAPAATDIDGPRTHRRENETKDALAGEKERPTCVRECRDGRDLLRDVLKDIQFRFQSKIRF